MRTSNRWKPSPSLFVAIVALVAALAGTAVGGVAVTSLSKKEKTQVQKIAKRLDRKAIKSIPSGPKGDTGPQGVQGSQGATGPQGLQGPQGAQGSQGATGLAGAGLTPAVFTSAGLINAAASGCAGSADGRWYDNDPATQHEVGYHRSESGMVYLRGVVLNCGAIGAIFVLPPGFRPGRSVYFAAATAAEGIQTRVTVQADGQVQENSTYGLDRWVSLDGIVFRCGPAATNGCP
ncbi:MAG: collagen-like protein [Solirubrobacterales bacterium]|nr:collagen-like protein [Solirubrobacterales bacterium]